MYKYLVIVKTGDGSKLYPSNSRDSKKHLQENKAVNCWIYDKNGWWVSFAELDKTTNKVYHPKMFLDGESRNNYADTLQQFNYKRSVQQ